MIITERRLAKEVNENGGKDGDLAIVFSGGNTTMEFMQEIISEIYLKNI